MKNQILRKTWEFWDSNLEKTSESITRCSMPRERPHIANCAKCLNVMMHFPRSLYRVVVLVRHGKEKQISVTIRANLHLWLLELSDIGYKSSLKNRIVGFLHFCFFELLHTDSLSVVWIFWGQLGTPIYFWGSFAFFRFKSAPQFLNTPDQRLCWLLLRFSKFLKVFYWFVAVVFCSQSLQKR